MIPTELIGTPDCPDCTFYINQIETETDEAHVFLPCLQDFVHFIKAGTT